MSVAEDAREEARARWSDGPQHGMSPQLHAGLLYGFIAGAVWQSERPVTAAEVEAVAEFLYGAFTSNRATEWQDIDKESDPPRSDWIERAQLALEAARKARMQ